MVALIVVGLNPDSVGFPLNIIVAVLFAYLIFSSGKRMLADSVPDSLEVTATSGRASQGQAGVSLRDLRKRSSHDRGPRRRPRSTSPLYGRDDVGRSDRRL